MTRFSRSVARAGLLLLLLGLQVVVGGVAFAQSDNPQTDPGGAINPPPAGIVLEIESDAETGAQVFRAGFLAVTDAAHQQRLFRPFGTYLEAILQRPVAFVPYRNARGLMLAMQRGQIAYAMAPGSVFAAMHRLCACVTPLATQPNFDGSIGLLAAVLAMEGSPIGSADDLSGARLAVVSQGSVVAHRVGLAELEREEIAIDQDRLRFFATLEEAAAALLDGDVDAILTWTRQAEGGFVFDQEPARALDDETRTALRFIWRSRPIPGHTHFIHAGQSEALGRMLQSSLVSLGETNGDAFAAIDRGSDRGFVVQTMEDYQTLLDAYAYWDGVGQNAR